MDNELTIFMWRSMLGLSVVVIPACLIAGPAGWVVLVLWVAIMSSVIPNEGERSRITPQKRAELARRQARSQADRAAQARYNAYQLGR